MSDGEGVIRARRRVELPSLEQHVYELIKEDILNGTLQPGMALVEARLADEFGVSKTPVREALIRLRLDGLVRIERFRGARVTEPSVHDVQEIFMLRRWIEGGIAEELARSRPLAAIEEMRVNIEAAGEALTTGDERRYLDEIRAFDHILARAVGNSLVARVLSDLYNIFGLIGAATLTVPERRQRSIDEHMDIYNSIVEGKPDDAVVATLNHIRSIEHDYLQAVMDRDGREGRPAAPSESGGADRSRSVATSASRSTHR
jgi:DNA-binding GntR family transcriptional regulator